MPRTRRPSAPIPHDTTTPATPSDTPAYGLNDDAIARAEAFELLTGNFWRAWGDFACPDWQSNEELNQRADKVGDTYWRVCNARAPAIRFIAEKVRVLRTQVEGDAGTWADARVETMIASILIDLERGDDLDCWWREYARRLEQDLVAVRGARCRTGDKTEVAKSYRDVSDCGEGLAGDALARRL